MQQSVLRTNADRIYQDLRESILFLDPEPGAPLDVNAIANTLGVSRSPVRDALLRLSRDGLVEIRPQRGTLVSLIDPVKAHEERFMRENLELPALALFASERDGDHFARFRDSLASALASQRLALQRGDLAAFLAGDDAFHRTIFAAASKSRCWEAVNAMSGHYRRIRYLALRSHSTPDTILDEHGAIYSLVAERNEAGATALMRRHLARLDVDESALRREYPSYFAEGEPQ